VSVAVLIVNYRVYDELDEALTSLERGLRPGDEVVVFDQAGDPARLEWVTARHPAVRFIASDENLGFAAGINRAAAATTAPHLLWLNPDTHVEGPLLDVLEAWLDSHPDTGCVGPRVRNDDGSVQESARRFPGLSTAIGGRSTWLTRHFPRNPLSRRNLLAASAAGTVIVDWLAGACLMTPRRIFERAGGLDESFFLYWEDCDYCRRVASAGFSSVYLPEVNVRHAGGRSAARNPAPAIRAFHASAYRLYTKHVSPIAQIMRPFVRAALWTRGEILARAAARRRP
jgi:GT2 family glycosyltransferase